MLSVLYIRAVYRNALFYILLRADPYADMCDVCRSSSPSLREVDVTNEAQAIVGHAAETYFSSDKGVTLLQVVITL